MPIYLPSFAKTTSKLDNLYLIITLLLSKPSKQYNRFILDTPTFYSQKKTYIFLQLTFNVVTIHFLPHWFDNVSFVSFQYIGTVYNNDNKNIKTWKRCVMNGIWTSVSVRLWIAKLWCKMVCLRRSHLLSEFV